MDSSNLATLFAPNILHNCSKGAGKDEMSAERVEERSDAINVVRSLIDNYKTLFQVCFHLIYINSLKMFALTNQTFWFQILIQILNFRSLYFLFLVVRVSIAITQIFNFEISSLIKFFEALLKRKVNLSVNCRWGQL